MAFTSAELTAKQQADFAKDYPILIGQNSFDNKNLFIGNWTIASGSHSTDKTNADFPFYNCTGRDATQLTKSTGSGQFHSINCDAVGEVTNSTCDTSTSSNPDRISYDAGLADYLLVGMYVRDAGTSRVIPRGAKITSVSSTYCTIDKNVLSTTTNTTLTFSGKPEGSASSFDTILWFNHNLHNGTGGLGNSISPTIRIRDYQQGTATIINSGSSSDTPDGKPVILSTLRTSSDSSAPRKYSNVAFCAIDHYATDGSVSNPYVGCVWAGERWQLPYWPDKPYHDKGTESHAVDYHGKNGAIVRHSEWQGRAFRDWSVPLSSSIDVDACVKFSQDTEMFSKPFILIENPSTNPTAYIMVAQSASMAFSQTNKNERVFNLTMVEKPPFYSSY